MANKDKRLFERVIAMAHNIPVEPRGIRVAELCNLLNNNNNQFDVSRKTIERDLKTYALPLGLEQGLVKSDPYQWSMLKSSPFRYTQRRSIDEALSLTLAEAHLKQHIPLTIYKSLIPIFSEADLLLRDNKKLASWKNKIASVPDGFTVHPCDINEDVLSVIHEALLSNKIINIRYGENEKIHPIKPLGLIIRGKKLVLVCTYYDYEEESTILVHRIKKAELTTECFKTSFDLNRFLKSDEVFILKSDTPLELKLHVTDYIRRLLTELELVPNQHVQKIDDKWLSVQATIGHTTEFENWVVSHSPDIKVIEPLHFKNIIAQRLKKSLSYYE